MIQNAISYSKSKNQKLYSWMSESGGGLAFGVILTFLFAFISTGYGHYKDKFAKKGSPQIDKAGAFCLNYLLKLIIMFLVMSMNFYVCLAVVLGMTFGQLTFDVLSQRKRIKKKKDEVDDWLNDCLKILIFDEYWYWYEINLN